MDQRRDGGDNDIGRERRSDADGSAQIEVGQIGIRQECASDQVSRQPEEQVNAEPAKRKQFRMVGDNCCNRDASKAIKTTIAHTSAIEQIVTRRLHGELLRQGIGVFGLAKPKPKAVSFQNRAKVITVAGEQPRSAMFLRIGDKE